MTYFEKSEQKQFFSMFSMLNAIGEISKVANFITPCVNITNSAFTQLSYQWTVTTLDKKKRGIGRASSQQFQWHMCLFTFISILTKCEISRDRSTKIKIPATSCWQINRDKISNHLFYSSTISTSQEKRWYAGVSTWKKTWKEYKIYMECRGSGWDNSIHGQRQWITITLRAILYFSIKFLKNEIK